MNRPFAVLWLMCAAAATVSAQQTFRTEVDLVHFSLVVTDKQGAPITGLTAGDFEVVEEGKPQAIKFFAAGDPDTAPPLHIGFLLDTSGSMEEDIKDVADRGREVPQRDGHRRRHHARGLRHRSAGRQVCRG